MLIKVNGAVCHFDLRMSTVQVGSVDNLADKNCVCTNQTTKKRIDNVCYITLDNLDTLWNGRCYTITLTHNVTTLDSLYIVFRLFEVITLRSLINVASQIKVALYNFVDFDKRSLSNKRSLV